MGENSKIEWCDHTVNLWWGCSKVNEGCKNCYAETLSDKRYKKNLWGENRARQYIKSAIVYLNKYQKQAEKSGINPKVFIGSMMDIFEDSKPLEGSAIFLTTDDLRWVFFNRIEAGQWPNLIFLFLTKRPENILKSIPPQWVLARPKNVWIGVSISSEELAWNARNILVDSGMHSQIFYSIEPQLHRIANIDLRNVDWVIQGGESGRGKRPFELEWARIMMRLCYEQNTPYFFKQIDKVQAVPELLKIREFPEFNL